MLLDARKVGVDLLLLLFFLIHKSLNSCFNFTASVAYLLHALPAFSWTISWVGSLSWVDSFSWVDPFPFPRIASLSWKSGLWYSFLAVTSDSFSAIDSDHFLAWLPYDFSSTTDRSRNLFRSLFLRLSVTVSASSAVVNWVIWVDSSPDIIDRIVSVHPGNHFNIVLPFRIYLFFRLLRSDESILDHLFGLLTHLGRRNDLRDASSKMISRIDPSEFSFRLRLIVANLILWSRESSFEAFQIFRHNDSLQKASLTGLTVVLSIDFTGRHVSQKSRMGEQINSWNSLTRDNFQTL